MISLEGDNPSGPNQVSIRLAGEAGPPSLLLGQLLGPISHPSISSESARARRSCHLPARLSAHLSAHLELRHGHHMARCVFPGSSGSIRKKRPLTRAEGWKNSSEKRRFGRGVHLAGYTLHGLDAEKKNCSCYEKGSYCSGDTRDSGLIPHKTSPHSLLSYDTTRSDLGLDSHLIHHKRQTASPRAADSVKCGP